MRRVNWSSGLHSAQKLSASPLGSLQPIVVHVPTLNVGSGSITGGGICSGVKVGVMVGV